MMEDTESDRDVLHIGNNSSRNASEEPYFAYLGDCLVLFKYAWENRDWPQSMKGLANQCGIKRNTLSGYIRDHRRHRGSEPPTDCLLCIAAQTFRYDIAVHPDGQRRVIDAIPRGYTEIPLKYQSRDGSVGATMSYSYDTDDDSEVDQSFTKAVSVRSWAVEDVTSLPGLPCGRCAVPDVLCTFRSWFEAHRPGQCVVWCPFYLARGKS